MSESTADSAEWTESERPPSLHRRFFFQGYGDTRTFLDEVAELSKETGIYPDVSFGKDYANLTIHAEEGAALEDAHRDLARRVLALSGDPA